MKTTVGALILLASVLFIAPSKANSANLEWLGIVSGFGGAERESGLPAGSPLGHPIVGLRQDRLGVAGGRGIAHVLGVVPIFGPLGAQASFQYTGGNGSRFATTFGPLYDFTAGKVGLFASYQHRNLRDGNFWWLEPALDYYLGQVNLSLRYIQPISSAQKTVVTPCCFEDRSVQHDRPINRLQATASYFPPDFISLGKDNLELTFGAQVNTFGGPYSKISPAGVGPVFGLAMMPAQNVEITLIKGTVDNRSRYDIQSGIRIYFGKSMPSTSPASSPSLKELRRKYMEASPYPVSGYSTRRHTNVR